MKSTRYLLVLSLFAFLNSNHLNANMISNRDLKTACAVNISTDLIPILGDTLSKIATIPSKGAILKHNLVLINLSPYNTNRTEILSLIHTTDSNFLFQYNHTLDSETQKSQLQNTYEKQNLELLDNTDGNSAKETFGYRTSNIQFKISRITKIKNGGQAISLWFAYDNYYRHLDDCDSEKRIVTYSNTTNLDDYTTDQENSRADLKSISYGIGKNVSNQNYDIALNFGISHLENKSYLNNEYIRAGVYTSDETNRNYSSTESIHHVSKISPYIMTLSGYIKNNNNLSDNTTKFLSLRMIHGFNMKYSLDAVCKDIDEQSNIISDTLGNNDTIKYSKRLSIEGITLSTGIAYNRSVRNLDITCIINPILIYNTGSFIGNAGNYLYGNYNSDFIGNRSSNNKYAGLLFPSNGPFSFPTLTFTNPTRVEINYLQTSIQFPLHFNYAINNNISIFGGYKEQYSYIKSEMDINRLFIGYPPVNESSESKLVDQSTKYKNNYIDRTTAKYLGIVFRYRNSVQCYINCNRTLTSYDYWYASIIYHFQR